MRYKIALRESEEGFSVSVPGLPGCWSQGVTEDEARRNIQDAIQEYLADVDELLARAIAVSPPKRSPEADELLAKIRKLPPERVAEVEDFVDFLRSRDEEQQLTRAASHLSEAAFAKVWDHPDDADYDRL
jgi:predicted RNase H-like HicB family nuclease